jgi:hypothetical protein
VGVITLPVAVKTVTGHVYIEGSLTGVPDAEVTAHRLDEPGFANAPTDGNGMFNLGLTGGEWHISVAPLTAPADWIFANPPEWVVFARNSEPESRMVNLEVVPANASVSGSIGCPSPDIGLCPPGDAIRVELRNDNLRTETVVGGDPRTYPFGIPVPAGWYELVVHVDDPRWQGPRPIPLYVGRGDTYDVGLVLLQAKDATITGRVRSEAGAGVPGIPVIGWQPDEGSWGYAQTDENGDYTIRVVGGEWFVEPQPGPNQPFVFRHRPALVRVAPGGRLEGVDFELTRATARIMGTAVDINTNKRVLGLNGWAWAERFVTTDTLEFFSDAPMRDSSFELKVKGNAFYRVGVEVPPQSRYVSGGTGPIGVPNLTEVPVAVPLRVKNAGITGRLVIAGSAPPEPAPGVWAEVFGEDETGHWVAAGVNQETARYAVGVVSGTWQLRAWVDPASGYVAIPTTTLVTVQSGQVASPVDFPVWPINSLISGTVKAPDGTPREAIVFAEGESPYIGHYETHAWTDAVGHFELLVPEGGYVVGAALPGDVLDALGWLNPAPVDVPWVASDSPVLNLELRFRQLDGEIHGTIRFAPGTVVTTTHPAYVWGWSDNGEWTEAVANPTGIDTFSYTLRVVSDTVWHIGAVYEDGDNGVYYESLDAIVSVPPTTPVAQAFQNLVLRGPYALPQPFIVSFDGTQMQTIVMPDGVVLRVPPGALVDSGTVTLFIFPTRELRPERGREIIGVGYEIWAVDEKGQEITQFNKNVIMTFPYPPDEELQQQGISEQLLVPVYYSTLAGRWILADSYVLDTVNNKIRLQINHFSRFGTFSLEPGDHYIYLPLVMQNSQ